MSLFTPWLLTPLSQALAWGRVLTHTSILANRNLKSQVKQEQASHRGQESLHWGCTELRGKLIPKEQLSCTVVSWANLFAHIDQGLYKISTCRNCYSSILSLVHTAVCMWALVLLGGCCRCSAGLGAMLIGVHLCLLTPASCWDAGESKALWKRVTPLTLLLELEIIF